MCTRAQVWITIGFLKGSFTFALKMRDSHVADQIKSQEGSLFWTKGSFVPLFRCIKLKTPRLSSWKVGAAQATCTRTQTPPCEV